MAQELGYEQITGTNYLKGRDGWFEGFSLQASSYGNDFFFINYGVAVPNLWEPFDKEVEKENLGYQISNRLHDNHDQGFYSRTKDEIERSAETALLRYREQAVPWFESIKGLMDVAERYYEYKSLDNSKLGQYTPTQSLGVANYGLLLFKAGNLPNALEWLSEAERLYSLDEDLEDYEIEQQETIRNVIKLSQSA